MNTYKIKLKMTTYCDVVIDAESKGKAWRIMEDTMENGDVDSILEYDNIDIHNADYEIIDMI